MEKIDEFIKLRKQIEGVLNDFINKYELDYGNGYVTVENNDAELVVEAPNNATCHIYFYEEIETLKEIYNANDNNISDDEILNTILPEIKASLYEFDADNEFCDIWSPNFQYLPSKFIQMLQEDEEYFKEVAGRI